MPARRHALVLNAITAGPLVILLAPDHFVRWADHRAAITTALRETFGIKAKAVFSVEGLAGYPEGMAHDDPAFLARALAAPSDPAILPSFHFFEWRDGRYVYVRPAAC